MNDINAEFKRYQECCIAAGQALESQNYQGAVDLFGQALEKAQRYSPNSLDEVYCLQGLADAYYGLNQFFEAKPYFEKVDQLLQQFGETATERSVIILFKLGRCYEKSRELDQACEVLARATAIAEPNYPTGHPKLTGILESYANVLRLAHRDPQAVSEIERKAAFSRSKQTGSQNMPASPTATAQRLEPIPRTEKLKPPVEPKVVPTRDTRDTYVEPEQEGGSFAEKLNANSRLIFAGVVSLLFLLMIVLSFVGTIDEMKGGKPPSEASPAAVGKKYSSADGSETIQFIGKGKVNIKGAAGFTCARCYEATPGFSEIIAAFILQSPKQTWLVPNALGLRDPINKEQLYDLKKCPIKDLPKQMELVARACLLNILKYHTYLDATSILAAVPEVKDKLSDDKAYMPLVVSGDPDVMPKEIHHFVDHKTEDLVHKNYAPNKIVCMTIPGAQQKTVIWATDGTGAAITSQSGVQLTLVISDGQVIASDGLTTKVAFFQHLPKSLVLSTSTPDVIRQLYVKGTFLWIMLGTLAYAGYRLKTYRVPTTSGRADSDVQLPLKLRVLLWLGFAIVSIINLYFLEENTSAYFFR